MLDALHHAWPYAAAILFVADIAVRLALAIRVVYKRSPVPDTLSWLLLFFLVPFLSWALYALIGGNRLGSRRSKRYEHLTRSIEERALLVWQHEQVNPGSEADEYAHLAALATNVSGFPTFGGNKLELIADAETFLTRLVADIDAAVHHVHLCYYIWDPDAKGTLLADAVIRAAQRGVTCRVLVDSVGSKTMLGDELWDRMQRAGVKCSEALPASFWRAWLERVDLRNHRKVAVIDGRTGYCGSQNVTEENFRSRIGSRAGPWIDATVRLTGPAVHPLQITFLRDWAMDSDEKVGDAPELLPRIGAAGPSAVHVVPSGPGPRPDAIHQALLAMLYAARREIVMTTPYFVPDEATKSAILNAALRGVSITLMVPETSDSSIVAAAGRSHFEELLEAGVKIWKHQRGLLHVKAMTVDHRFSIIGSANFDVRSFWLNFESTLFIVDDGFTSKVCEMQAGYLRESRQVSPDQWRKRPRLARFCDHCAQLFGPLL